MDKQLIQLGVVFLTTMVLQLSGCRSYMTPGAGVNLQAINDEEVRDFFAAEPAAEFPSRIAVLRLQASGYRSYGNYGYGRGRFSVVTTRDVETDVHFSRLSSLTQVASVATMNRILLPAELQSTKDLRKAAAQLQCDVLLLYTIDTSFWLEGRDVGPLDAITLGFIPYKNATVTATASSALYDVRTGYLYGINEATVQREQNVSTWSAPEIVENGRLAAEKEAFGKLLDEFCTFWPLVVQKHAETREMVGMQVN